MKKHIVKKSVNIKNQDHNFTCVSCAIATILGCETNEINIPSGRIGLSEALNRIPGVVNTRLNSLEELKKELYISNNFLLLGYRMCDDFDSVSDEGYIHYDGSWFRPQGHCVVCCGYDDEKQALLCINSRGLDYGIGIDGIASGGLVWISYDYPIEDIRKIEDNRDKVYEPRITTNDYINNASYTNTMLHMSYEELLAKHFDKYCGERLVLGQDSNGLDTYYYEITPQKYTHTVLISAGMNACELAPIFGLSYFLKSIVEENIYNFKNCTRFIILPIICPSSFNECPKKYLNPNDVRINKNFDYESSWENVTVDLMGTKGEYPDSEMETLNLKRWLRMFSGADLWIDCHADLENLSNVLFNTYVSHMDLLNLVYKAQRDIKEFYIKRGCFRPIESSSDGIIDSLNYIEQGNMYPKTLYAWKKEEIPSIMIEQWARTTLYGASGQMQCEENSIKNYVVMLSQYCLKVINQI